MPYDDNGNWVEDRDEDGMDQGDTTGDDAINPNDLYSGGGGNPGTGNDVTDVFGGGDTNTGVTEVNEVTDKGDTKGDKTDPNDTVGDGVTDTGSGTDGGGDYSSSVTGGEAPAGDPGPPIPDSGTGMEAKQYDWDVTEEQTVMGQLEKNYDENSPFFELAAERAKRGHQASGGQNSLMAGQAGQIAAMDQAFKASFKDAETYARSAEFNAAMKNQFGLAEQRFIHNATLSDQNFAHSKILMKQQIQGQMDMMDKEFAQFFPKAKYQSDLAIDQLWEAATIHENQEQAGFARTMALNAATSLSAFMSNGFGAVMESANDPNFTPEQSRAAFASGMAALTEQWDVMNSFWMNQVSGSSSSSSNQASYPYSDPVTENYGYYGEGANSAWAQWMTENYGG